MKRWLPAFCLRNPRRTLLTHSRSDNEEIGVPMPDTQSWSPDRDDSEQSTRSADRDGNIISNICFEDGLNSWSARGCKILLLDSLRDGRITPLHGSFFASATNRTQSWNGIQQDISSRVKRKIPYEVTAVVRTLGNISTNVSTGLWVQYSDRREQYISIAASQASEKEWVSLQGKFLLNGVASKAVIYIVGPPAGTDILVNSLVVKRAKKRLPSPPPDIKNALFGVNIIENSNLNQGLNRWSSVGSCTLRICIGSPCGRYILATNRTQTWMGPSQKITDKLKAQLTYQVSAWVCLRSGVNVPQTINLTLKVDGRWLNAGQVQTTDDRWYEVRGAFRLEMQPSEAVIYVSGPHPGVDLMVAGLNIFPVDRKARFKYLEEKTDKVRKRDIILKFTGIDGRNVECISVEVRQIKNNFAFGSHINRSLIENEEFVDFFLKNFSWAVFGNELKWNFTEPQQGKLNYNDADVLLDFCRRHGIETRGHCIFWEVEDTVQPWVRSLNRNDLMIAVQNRLKGLVSRYKGKFRHYDVNNEMLHGSFYRERLGDDIGAYMFRETHRLDPYSILFVNDYNVEGGCDSKATPEVYMNQILDLQERGAPVRGIGLQGHICNPIGEIICNALDKFGVLGLPIWFTELDVTASNEHIRADDLEIILREAYAHPSVEGVMIWGHFELMCRENSQLVDAEGEINEAGKRFLALKQEWMSHAEGHVDVDGRFRFRGYHGEYVVEVTTPWKKSSQSFVVEKGENPFVLTMNL